MNNKPQLFNKQVVDQINNFETNALKVYFENVLGVQNGIKNIAYLEGLVTITFDKTMNLDLKKQDVLKTLIDGGALRVKEDEDLPITAKSYIAYDGVGRNINGNS